MTEITQYEVDERQVAKIEIYDKIEEMMDYEGMNAMPATWALKMVQLYIKHMDDNDEVWYVW